MYKERIKNIETEKNREIYINKDKCKEKEIERERERMRDTFWRKEIIC